MMRILLATAAMLALAGCVVEPVGYSPGYAQPTYSTPAYVAPAPVYVAPPTIGLELGGGGGYHHHDGWRR